MLCVLYQFLNAKSDDFEQILMVDIVIDYVLEH
jgi:hypothetical protein